MTKLIYLASPYSSKDPLVMQGRETMINIIAANLQELYKQAMFCPILQSAVMNRLNPKLGGGDFAAWKDVDLCAISKCDELWVVTMPGWKESIGVQAEIEFAREKGIPIYYLNEGTNYLGLEDYYE